MDKSKIGDKEEKDKSLRGPSDEKDLRLSYSTGQISTAFTRSLSSDSQLPGAYAIPGPQLLRQERISFPDALDREQEPHILIEARVVDEEQPSLIFEAFLLRKRKNWKWIVTVCCLLFLLTAAVATMFVQESNRKKSPEATLTIQTNDQPEQEKAQSNIMIPSVAPIDTTSDPTFPTTSTQTTNIPSIYKDMVQSQFPTLSTEQEKAQPTASPKPIPTAKPLERLPETPSYSPSYKESKAPIVLNSQGPSVQSTSFHLSSEPSSTNSLYPSVAAPTISSSTSLSFRPSFMTNIHIPIWKEVGESIISEDEGDALGRSIAMSEDGKILAIGISLYDLDAQQDTGKVRVFKLGKDNSWKQIGQEIIGVAAGDQAGRSVDLSSDGSIVAVGSKGMVQVFVYDRDYNFWSPLRRKLTAGGSDIFFGSSISVSNDGMFLMVAADVDDGGGKATGKVQIFKYDTLFRKWNKQTLRRDIPVEVICLNGAGDFAALGVPHITATDVTNAGFVEVYKRTTINTILASYSWNLLGDTLRMDEDGFGFSTDLSEDGMTLAVSSKCGVHLYQFDTKNWKWVKSNAQFQLELEDTTDISNEIRVSLSPNGRTLAVSEASSSSSGAVQVYEFNEDDNQWLKVGHVIKNSDTKPCPASSISLENDTQLAIGFVHCGYEEELNLGKVKVYEWR